MPPNPALEVIQPGLWLGLNSPLLSGPVLAGQKAPLVIDQLIDPAPGSPSVASS